MPFLVVWTATIDETVTDASTDPPAVLTVRAKSKRCGIWLEQIAYAEERTISSGEVYVFATMTNNTSIYIFEQTLDSLRELSQPEDKPNA
jgi:hypothetical protein